MPVRLLFVSPLFAVAFWAFAPADAAQSAVSNAESQFALREYNPPRRIGQFSLKNSIIDLNEVKSGGPRKDGIPSLTNPSFIPAAQARHLKSSDRILGVTIGGESKAYPIGILNWHEAVNDTVGGVAVAVTYCPLCDSALVFDRNIGGKTREFGISGLLWNSNVLLYDREGAGRESLWSQALMRAAAGPAAAEGLRLKLLPAEMSSWWEWKFRHPGSKVMSPNTGHRRDYQSNPYTRYFESDKLMFPAKQIAGRPEGFRAKEPMILVQVGPAAKAYAIKHVAAAAGSDSMLEDKIGGHPVRLSANPPHEQTQPQ